jgi:hypothetical protein
MEDGKAPSPEKLEGMPSGHCCKSAKELYVNSMHMSRNTKYNVLTIMCDQHPRWGMGTQAILAKKRLGQTATQGVSKNQVLVQQNELLFSK